MKKLNLSQFNFSAGEYKGKKVIWISHTENENSIKVLREYVKLNYSSSMRSWYIDDTTYNRHKIGEKINPFPKVEFLPSPHQKAFEDYFQTLKLKSYSDNTIRTYGTEFISFLEMFKHYNPDDITTDLIRRYLVYCAEDLKLTEHFINSKMNAIKFYYEKVLLMPKVVYNIPRPKKPLLLPKVLSVREIRNLFDQVDNSKHLLMLKCIYGMGLRVSEIVSLRIADIDSDTMLVHLKGAKGKKDRVVVLPDSILDELRTYYKNNQPHEFLFENRFGESYNVRSIQAIFKKALRKTTCRKNVGIHSLRHSYATHLLEYGTDVSLIQQLLGHNNIKTTLTYTHVSKKSIQNVRSPLDDLL